MELIPRTAESYLMRFAGQYPVVTISGPRQSGKTTLCRKVFADKKYVSLENPDTRQFAREDPRGFLAGLPGGAVMEALKYRLHRGMRSNLHFYRDSNGNEVDLLLSLGPDLYPVEIKAGMTINRDFFRGLDYFAGIFPLPLGRVLVYGGDQTQQRTGTTVCPAAAFHRLLEGLKKE